MTFHSEIMCVSSLYHVLMIKMILDFEARELRYCLNGIANGTENITFDDATEYVLAVSVGAKARIELLSFTPVYRVDC